MSCAAGHSSDPALPWLCYRPAAAALFGPLAWDPPYAGGVTLKRKTRLINKNAVISLLLKARPARSGHHTDGQEDRHRGRWPQNHARVAQARQYKIFSR